MYAIQEIRLSQCDMIIIICTHPLEKVLMCAKCMSVDYCQSSLQLTKVRQNNNHDTIIDTTSSYFLLCIGLGIVDFVDPPSGTIIFNLEGTINATTLTCNISHNGQQVSTQWNWVRASSLYLISITEGSEHYLISGPPDLLDTRFSL